MTKINLLPWREARREQEKNNVIRLLLSSVVIAAGIVFLVHQYAVTLVDEQTHRNQRLQDEITRLDGELVEIKKLKEVRDGLISRMTIVHSLLSGRIITIHLFDELIKVIPPGIYLTEVKRTNDLVTLQGYSESNSNVSILMKNIQQNPWLHDPVLTDIKKSEKNTNTEKTDNSEFNLSFVLKPKTTTDKKP